MPELPEVETVRRTLERVLVGRKITNCEFVSDPIVFKGQPPALFEKAVMGATVTAAKRHGKYFWLELDTKPWIFAHLGMAGWLREIGASTIRLREHGNAPMEDANGRPKFLKMMLESEEGRQIAMTDGRRLARIWALDSPEKDRAIRLLGPDCYNDPMSGEQVAKAIGRRSAPIKALLLDQSLFAGVGNWIADEVLYQARIRPSREGNSLSAQECDALSAALKQVIDHAVEVGADKENFPESWLFGKRWGGKKGHPEIEGKTIVRETIGGRTTAWVPEVQK